VIKRRKEKDFLLKGIPENLSSLSYAYLLAQKASHLGFDWPDFSGVLKKMDEELGEFREALSLRNRRRIAEEMGDLLFVLVNVGRFLEIDPEKALKGTIEKFCARFQYIETSLRRAGKTVQESNIIELDRLWEEAKRSRKTQRQAKAKGER
jgi:tetrapyrrole methylase family protein / MazG family protein